jgi:hypothetical protein
MSRNARRADLVLRLGRIVLESMCIRPGLCGKESDRQQDADVSGAVSAHQGHGWEY